MPPRKRKAPTKAAEPVKKKVRVDDTAANSEPQEQLATRPKRNSVGTPQYNFTRTRNTNKKQADNGPEAQDAATIDPVPAKRRGRPPKSTTTTASQNGTKTAATTQTRGRGRPATKNISAKPAVADDKPAPKKRGRPSKSNTASAIHEGPPKIKRTPPTTTRKQAAPKNVKPVKTNEVTPAAKGTAIPRKRGRPPKVVVPVIPTLDVSESDDIAGADFNDEDTDAESSDRQYWLMKAEPLDRIENGVNVKFSIDDLAAADAPEPWDGVRNYGARNNMRAMRKNDLAFFYHSNCPVPAIVGVMRIVQEHSPDQSAFNPNHPYYDPKSQPSNPRWDCVHVEFVKKFETQITLKMLQENRNRDGELKDMQMLRMSRLSVSAVTAKEWRFVLDMAGESDDVGEDVQGEQRDLDGYESDTDGEGHAGPREELNGMMANGDGEGVGEVE